MTAEPVTVVTSDTLYRLAVREAHTSCGPRTPGEVGKYSTAWVEHRYRELMARYGVEDDGVGVVEP